MKEIKNSELKSRVRFSTTLSIEVDALLKDYSKSSMIPTSKIVDKAILEYIEKQKRRE